MELFYFGKNIKPHNKYLDKETLGKYVVSVLLFLDSCALKQCISWMINFAGIKKGS